MTRAFFFIVFAFLTLLLIVPLVLIYIDFDVKYLLNNTSNNTSILIPSGNDSIINNSTTIVDVIEPPPSSKYLLYETFNTEDNWTKRSTSWITSYVNTSFCPSNVWIDNGNLVIYSNNDQHIGGEVNSKEMYSYGKYRASIKTTINAGCSENFYSYIWAQGGGILHNEIDGPELWKPSSNSEPVMANLNNAVGYGSNSSFGTHYTLPFDPSAAYHVYGYNWYPDRVEYVIDDKIVATSTVHVPYQPMYICFSNWVMRNIPSDHGDGQNYEYVDWVTYEPL